MLLGTDARARTGGGRGTQLADVGEKLGRNATGDRAEVAGVLADAGAKIFGVAFPGGVVEREGGVDEREGERLRFFFSGPTSLPSASKVTCASLGSSESVIGRSSHACVDVTSILMR